MVPAERSSGRRNGVTALPGENGNFAKLRHAGREQLSTQPRLSDFIKSPPASQRYFKDTVGVFR